ncbi:MAG: hypothetical protein FD171_1278 [Actinobacteria bacterium]|nr:MAG: hypothetical protein FD171_1278 [Actinomycetota bacterium]
MNLVVDCPVCEAKSRGDVLASHIGWDDVFDRYENVSLVKCPACSAAVLVAQADRNPPDAPGYDWGTPWRVWPRALKTLSQDIPEDVRKNIDEAQKCFRAGAYNACAVMCGRALEAVAHAFGTKKKVLAGGLQDLRDAGVIDHRLYEWGDALRSERNVAAHASGGDITKTDASDLIEFTNAICEYVFVLTARFEKFMERKKSPETSARAMAAPRGKPVEVCPADLDGEEIPF